MKQLMLTGLVNSLIILFFIFLALLFCFSMECEDFGIIRAAQAESTDSESESDNLPKVNKGKGRATEAEIIQQEQRGDLYKQEVTRSDSDLDLNKSKSLQEQADRAFAISLQEQEYNEEFNPFLEENQYKKQNKDESLESDSSYSCYSSEMHSDDSDNTKEKKLSVKELEKSLKRKEHSDDDVNYLGSNKRNKPSKD
jgi:hypothetical protein